MTAAVWQSNTSTSGSGTTTGATVSVPGSVADGDFLILTVSTGTNSNSGASTHTTPSGWTLIQSATRGGTRVSAYWRIAASEPADYSPVWASQTGGHLLTINRFTGAASSSPIDVSSTANGNGSTATASTVTTTVADALLVCVYAHTATGGNKFSQPSGMSEKWDLAGTGSNGPGSALDTETIASAGATGSRASTLSFSDNWGAVAFAIKPAAGSIQNLNVSGDMTPSGAIVKRADAVKAGGLTPSGVLVKLISMATTGGLTPSGVLVKLISMATTGGLTPSGVLVRTARKVWAGALTLAGAIANTLIPGSGPAPSEQRGTVTLAESALHTATLTESALHTCTLAESA